MSKRRKHGERNQKLSDKLLSEKVYYDWVITTAFYSAIHIVEDKVLPCEIRGQECKNITDVRRAYNMKGRHAAREKLVSKNLDIQISIRYKWLDDKSRYSRYTTFKVAPNEALKAQEFLNYILNN